jgi:hypothetical protein
MVDSTEIKVPDITPYAATEFPIAFIDDKDNSPVKNIEINYSVDQENEENIIHTGSTGGEGILKVRPVPSSKVTVVLTGSSVPPDSKGAVVECGTACTQIQPDDDHNPAGGFVEQDPSNPIFNYKYPPRDGKKVTVHCEIFFAKNIISQPASSEAQQSYTRKAKQILERHNLGFAKTVEQTPLDFNRDVDINNIAQYMDDLNEIRKNIADRRGPDNGSVLSIIFVSCMNANSNSDNWRGKYEASKNFVLLNINRLNRGDWATMIHEIVHAAGLGEHTVLPQNPQPPFDVLCYDNDKNFPADGVRSYMSKRQVDAVGRAIFSQ